MIHKQGHYWKHIYDRFVFRDHKYNQIYHFLGKFVYSEFLKQIKKMETGLKMSAKSELTLDKDGFLNCNDCPRIFLTEILFENHLFNEHKKETGTKLKKPNTLKQLKMRCLFQIIPKLKKIATWAIYPLEVKQTQSCKELNIRKSLITNAVSAKSCLVVKNILKSTNKMTIHCLLHKNAEWYIFA